jgi:hypothetical protein
MKETNNEIYKEKTHTLLDKVNALSLQPLSGTVFHIHNIFKATCPHILNNSEYV